MSQTNAASLFLWWVLLLASVLLVLREMARWLKKRTIDQGAIADLPRLVPPMEEVTALATEFESFSRDRTGRLIIGRIVSDAVVDRVSLILKIGKVELARSSRDEKFVRENFGEYSAITNYFSENWIVKYLSSRAQRKTTRKSGFGRTCLEEIKTLIGQISAWEKENESSRGI